MISVIVVNYKTEQLTRDTLTALFNSNPLPPLEVILVDNNSEDGSAERLASEFPLKLIEMGVNAGFAKANNAGLKIATGEVILLLNSDVTLEAGALQIAYNTILSKREYGCVGGKLTLPSGEIDHACHRGEPTPLRALFYFTGLAKLFPKSRLFGGYNMSWLSTDSSHEIEALTGAFLCIRSEVYKTIGPLDERYFMYGEDLDWCARIRKAGWKILYEPKIKGIHHKGGSSRKRSQKLVYEFYRAMLIYYKTQRSQRASIVERALVTVSIYAICASALLKNALRRKL